MRVEKITGWQLLVIIICFATCCIGAVYLDPEFCVDEWGRQLLTEWIYKNGRLPVGDEKEILINSYRGNWGFSYAYRPYLSSVVNALFMRIFCYLGGEGKVLLFASRMCSVLSITGCCYYGMKTGNIMFDINEFSTLFGVMVCFVPQVMYLGMYQNNDSLALCGFMMLLYYLNKGRETKWKSIPVFGLGISVSICLLSYYSVYGWLLVTGVYFLYCIRNGDDTARLTDIIKKCVGIGLIIILLAGWVFVRNALLHDGDFLGMASEARSRQIQIEQGVRLVPFNRPSEVEGNTILNMLSERNFEWIRWTLMSSVGVFGYMVIYLPKEIYCVYYVIWGVLGVAGYICMIICSRHAEERTFAIMMLAGTAITLALCVLQSYYRDYQPQGRYVITNVVTLAYLVAYNFDKLFCNVDNCNGILGKCLKRCIQIVGYLLVLGWMGLFFIVLCFTMTKMC